MEQNKKYNDIITATQKLFYKYEFRKVTVEDICKEANVSKMTFYKYFPNKLEAAKTMIDKLFGKAMGDFDAMMESDISFAEKMKQIVIMKVERSKDAEMVIFQNLYTNAEPEIESHIQYWVNFGLDLTKKHFAKAQQNGDMRSDISIDMIKIAMDKMQNIAKDERVLEIYDNAFDFAMELSKLFLYGITNEEK